MQTCSGWTCADKICPLSLKYQTKENMNFMLCTLADMNHLSDIVKYILLQISLKLPCTFF